MRDVPAGHARAQLLVPRPGRPARAACSGDWRFVSKAPSASATKESVAGPELFHLVQPDQFAVFDPVNSHVTLGVDLPGPSTKCIDPAPLDFAQFLVGESQQLAEPLRAALLECVGAHAVVACIQTWRAR